MRTKREILKAALKGEKIESAEEARRIAAPKIEAAKKHYYETYTPGAERFPVMILTFPSPMDYMTYGDDYKKIKNAEK